MENYLVKLEASDGQITNVTNIDFQKAGFSAVSFMINCLGTNLKEEIIQKINSFK